MSFSRRPGASRHLAAVPLFLGLSVCLVALALWSRPPASLDGTTGTSQSASPNAHRPNTLAFGESWQPVVDQLSDANQLEPSLIGPYGSEHGLERFAAEAAIGAYLINGEASALAIDLAGRPRMADRVAIGLEKLGIGFSRSVEPDSQGFYGTHISIDSGGAGLLNPPAHVEAAEVRLATMIELGGSVEGRIATKAAALHVLALADEVGLATVNLDGELWIADLESVHNLAKLYYIDPTNVPVLGLRVDPSQFGSNPSPQNSSLGIDSNYWRVGVTGELPGSIALKWTGLGPDGKSPIGWTNAEAQSYQAENVVFEDGQFHIVTLPAEIAGVRNLPFTSGMAVSEEAFGWGTTTLEIELPAEPGLWPAIWLLDSQACAAPGICSGYGTDSYHEIDLLEMRTQKPNIAHMSVHWGESDSGVTRSSSATAVVGSDRTGLAIQLERRPGLLIWRIDDRVVHVMGGHVAGFDTGPHRNMGMRLIVNTAVGGTFAGETLIGRFGGWWGDSKAPAEFGERKWLPSELVVHSVSHIPLG